MRDAHPRERAVGMAYYASETDGLGGRLRDAPADFRVRELESVDPEPLDADQERYRHLLVRATLEDWDTTRFAGTLSDRLGISRGRVAWAGTKDKRAVTTQLFSIEDATADDLPDVGGATIDPVGRLGRRLHLGDLVGNAFEVVVRDPERLDDAQRITDELAAFAGLDGAGDASSTDPGTDEATTVGVPNYFGQQRFGSLRPITHEVGLAIVRRDWEGAVTTYVGNPYESEPEDTREARAYVEETRDWVGALDRMPDRMGYERAMLHHLASLEGEPAPEDYREALTAVPEGVRQLFVHAAQSYAFNRVLSERLERGLPFDRAVAGDVVCFVDEHGGTPDTPRIAVPDVDRTQRVTEDRLRAVNRHLARGRAYVTAPLVGTDTELGDGEPGEIEREVLADLDLSPGDFDLPEPFASSGTRRAILLRTDVSIEPGDESLGFSFALPKGSYATVVLREYLKTDPVHL